jgi:hypothetical protein
MSQASPPLAEALKPTSVSPPVAAANLQLTTPVLSVFASICLAGALVPQHIRSPIFESLRTADIPAVALSLQTSATSAVIAPLQANGCFFRRSCDRPKRPVSFIGIGAMKGGSTALDRYLRQIPDVTMPSNAKGNEVNFFEGYRKQDWEEPEVWYKQYEARVLEEAKPTDIIAGEVSPATSYYPNALERVYDYNPDMKLIMIMRDPGASQYKGSVGTDVAQSSAPSRHGTWKRIWDTRSFLSTTLCGPTAPKPTCPCAPSH